MKKKKNVRRMLALSGAALLAGLYLATLIFALIDSAWAYDLFKICVGFTIVVPTLLYLYALVYRLQKKRGEENNDLDHHL